MNVLLKGLGRNSEEAHLADIGQEREGRGSVGRGAEIEDVLDEDTILEWADAGRSEYTLDSVDEESRAILRGEAEPVVVWLQEAESDEEDDDE